MEINKIKNRNTIGKNCKSKASYLKISIMLANFVKIAQEKRDKEKIEITIIRFERGHYHQLYRNKKNYKEIL